MTYRKQYHVIWTHIDLMLVIWLGLTDNDVTLHIRQIII